MSGVPNVFGSATSSIPLSQLDVNFNTPVTIGNTTVGLGNTVTSFGNVTLTNTTVTVGNVTTDLTVHGLTVGQGAGSVSTNTAVGASALAANTSGANNTSLGYQALQANTTASNNTAVGYQAGYSNTTGIGNTCLGMVTGYSLTTGSGNVFIGFQPGNYGAGYFTTTGSYNSGVGGGALAFNTTGGNNTANGFQALFSNTTATNNTAVGYQSGYSTTTGGGNVFIGQNAGSASGVGMTTGTSNIVIGTSASASAAGDSQSITILASNSGGNGKGSSTGFINPGGGGVYHGNNSAAWSITSDKRLKKNIVDNTVGLSAINQIQVRNFEYRTADEVTELEPTSAIGVKGVQLGAIAQELKEILPDCVKTESTGVMSVDTTNLTWYLINAVKELNAKFEEYKATHP